MTKIVLGITKNSFDFSIVTRLVTFAKDLHYRRPVTNSNESFISPNNLSKMGQMSKICSQALLFGQPLTNCQIPKISSFGDNSLGNSRDKE